MSWRTLAVLALVLIGAGSLWYLTGPGPLAFAGGRTVPAEVYTGTNPTGVPAELVQADLIERGRYLTEAADCRACHTSPGGAAFAGGRAFKSAFGTLYSPNITADRGSGIGTWSEADFLRAVHQGTRPDGVRLYPAFPYAAYTYLSDADVRAIRTYLMSLPPVKNVAPANALAFPFNQRWLMAIWAQLFNPDQRFRPNSERSPEWNRGAYLAEALAHCGDCHTPRNLLQALNNRRKFGGTVTAGWQAYNITSDPSSGVGAWSDQQLAQYLATGHAANHGTASGPMAEAVELSFSRLSVGDIGALVAYVRSVPALASPGLPTPRMTLAEASPALGVPADLDPRGKEIFEGACVSCHGWAGASALTARATLTGSRAVNDPSATNVAQMILSGSGGSGDGAGMPAFGAAYSDAEIAAVANYVTARFGAKPSTITAQKVAALRGAT